MDGSQFIFEYELTNIRIFYGKPHTLAMLTITISAKALLRIAMNCFAYVLVKPSILA
jgi:hypothetical protein